MPATGNTYQQTRGKSFKLKLLNGLIKIGFMDTPMILD